MGEELSKEEKIEKKLKYSKKSGWEGIPEGRKKEIEAFITGYKKFLDSSKTERLAAKNIVQELRYGGFKDICSLKKLSEGDKVYKVFKDRVVLAAIVGKDASFRIVGSHLDSPRIDLKPHPLFENNKVAMLKSHYYGGIKYYHWLNVPLALHAVVHTKAGRKEFSYGFKDSEPKFIIPDLLPHLSKELAEKPQKEALKAEQLNIVVGNVPVFDEAIKEPFKLGVLKKLNELWGLEEKDLLSADIQFVPSGRAIDVGFDSSMIASYGQDDRVCAYTALQALLKVGRPKATAIALFVDKEEIGSVGDTGAESFILKDFAEELLQLRGSEELLSKVFHRSKAISADVTAAINPNFEDVQDKTNCSFIGHGVAVEKYGGKGGKFLTNEASSEYMAEIVGLLDSEGINWQTGELGKLDVGGGGTIAMFISRFGISTIDVGPPVLAMHSTKELAGKTDIYNSYLPYKVFWEA